MSEPPRMIVITTAGSNNHEEYRTLPCGCEQRFIRGDIVTSQFADWVTVRHCSQHSGIHEGEHG